MPKDTSLTNIYILRFFPLWHTIIVWKNKRISEIIKTANATILSAQKISKVFTLFHKWPTVFLLSSSPSLHAYASLFWKSCPSLVWYCLFLYFSLCFSCCLKAPGLFSSSYLICKKFYGCLLGIYSKVFSPWKYLSSTQIIQLMAPFLGSS